MPLYGAIAETVRQNKEVTCGESAITASVAITTEYETIYSVTVTQKRNTAPALDSIIFTYGVVNNIVTIFAWQATAAGDVTMIAGTVATTVGYTIIGRRRQ